jgi:hypothetical protein
MTPVSGDHCRERRRSERSVLSKRRCRCYCCIILIPVYYRYKEYMNQSGNWDWNLEALVIAQIMQRPALIRIQATGGHGELLNFTPIVRNKCHTYYAHREPLGRLLFNSNLIKIAIGSPCSIYKIGDEVLEDRLEWTLTADPSTKNEALLLLTQQSSTREHFLSIIP